VEVVKPKDLKRAAHKLRISVDQLTNARAALKEATDLALRAEPPAANDYAQLSRLWIQLERKKSREMIGLMIAQASRQAQAAETLEGYRRCTSQAQQLLIALNEVDPDKAAQIAELWPVPAAKLGAEGEKALAQFQSDFTSRMLSQAAFSTPDQIYEQLQQPRKSAAVPFSVRTQVASALISSNQREKAKAVLDQAIEEMAKRPPEPGKNYDYENFLRELARLYPEKFLGAFNVYRDMVSRLNLNTNSGMVYQMGDRRVVFNSSETTTLNMLRGLMSRPELSMKLLASMPSLQDKVDQLGGIDNLLSPSGLSLGSNMVSFPAYMPDPRAGGSAYTIGPDRGAPPDQPVSPSQLLRTLRGQAEVNPESVRRKLADAYRKKEHFASLISLAQMASSQDPELSSIALDVAHSLLPLFDTLQQRSSSFRNLAMVMRQLDGEVDTALLREGFLLANEMQEEEKAKEQEGNRSSGTAGTLRPSDDFKIALIGLSALDDFAAALRYVRTLDGENLKIRALVQITQSLLSNY
jgi:hypothetical protein